LVFNRLNYKNNGIKIRLHEIFQYLSPNYSYNSDKKSPKSSSYGMQLGTLYLFEYSLYLKLHYHMQLLLFINHQIIQSKFH